MKGKTGMISHKGRKLTVLISMAVTSMITFAGCGTQATTTPSGTALTSKPFNTSVASFKLLDWLIPNALAVAPTITSFKFCVNKLKLEGSDGSAVTKDGSDLFEAKLGLIDLGDGTASINWGNLSLPAGTAIKKIKIVVHKDPEACSGVSYSASINDQSITKDLEFVFKFATPKPLADGDSVSVALTNVVNKLIAAANANQLDDDHISNYLDGSDEDDAE
jgi:hypothetical protein